MDARAQQAREHHEAAARYGSEADQHRRWRDRLVRSLRSEDPAAWSYGNLAQAVGCSKTLIRQILEHEEARHAHGMDPETRQRTNSLVQSIDLPSGRRTPEEGL